LRLSVAVAEERADEADRQLNWTRAELSGRLEGRERRIEELRQQLDQHKRRAEVARLQEECKRIYSEREDEAKDRVEDVTRRARTPREQRPQSVATVGDPVAPPLMRPPPSPTSARAKVFRHRLQRALGGPAGTANPVDKAAFNVAPVGASAVVPSHRASLPTDYRASVATLPPILGRSNSITGQASSPPPSSVASAPPRARTVSSAKTRPQQLQQKQLPQSSSPTAIDHNEAVEITLLAKKASEKANESAASAVRATSSS